jgi:hypothetical protein
MLGETRIETALGLVIASPLRDGALTIIGVQELLVRHLDDS